MKAKITATASLLILPLAACGSSSAKTLTPPVGVQAAPYNFDRPIQVVMEPDCAGWYGPASLDYLRNPAHYRAVALVTIDGQGDTRWNTPTGQRLTQAQEVAEEATSQRYTPFLMTGWSMHVVPGHVFRGNVPGSIVAYSVGGRLGQDSMRETGTGCLLTKPQPGHSYLVAFGEEIDRQARSSLLRPVIAQLLPYNPATNVVTTPGGDLPLPAKL